MIPARRRRAFILFLHQPIAQAQYSQKEKRKTCYRKNGKKIGHFGSKNRANFTPMPVNFALRKTSQPSRIGQDNGDPQ
jgi:hypothetical protein